MSNNDFEQTIWSPQEQVISGDLNVISSYLLQAVRDAYYRQSAERASVTDFTMQTTPNPSFLGDGFKVVAQSPVTLAVNVTAGLGFQGDAASVPTNIGGYTGVNDVSRMKPLVLSATQPFVVPPNASGLTRVDIIEVKYRRELSDTTNRNIMSLVSPFPWVSTPVPKVLTWDVFNQTGTVVEPASSTAYLSYKQGIPGAGTPATTAGYIKLCEINVITGAVSISQIDITDDRRQFTTNHKQEIDFTISVDTGTGAVTLLSFAAPPGIEEPTILSAAEVNGRMTWTYALQGAGLPNGSYSGDRVTVHTSMDVNDNNYYPICTNRLVNSSGGAPINGQVQSIILQMGAALALGAPARVVHINPTVYRTTIRYW